MLQKMFGAIVIIYVLAVMSCNLSAPSKAAIRLSNLRKKHFPAVHEAIVLNSSAQGAIKIFHTAVAQGNVELVKSFIICGFNSESLSPEGLNALQIAIINKQPALKRLFYQIGMQNSWDVGFVGTDVRAYTPLCPVCLTDLVNPLSNLGDLCPGCQRIRMNHIISLIPYLGDLTTEITDYLS